MSNTEWQEWEDEYGKWKKSGNVLLHVEPSQLWIDENPPQEPEPQTPTESEILTDYIIDVDYRVTMIELGL